MLVMCRVTLGTHSEVFTCSKGNEKKGRKDCSSMQQTKEKKAAETGHLMVSV